MLNRDFIISCPKYCVIYGDTFKYFNHVNAKIILEFEFLSMTRITSIINVQLLQSNLLGVYCIVQFGSCIFEHKI
jgi:hypothetical protein